MKLLVILFLLKSKNNISLLDISITRINNKLTTSLQRKKTFSGVYFNFNSFFTYGLQKRFNP